MTKIEVGERMIEVRGMDCWCKGAWRCIMSAKGVMLCGRAISGLIASE